MSREDPTIVVTPIASKMFLGGAGIVAAHAASLGASVEFISVSGNDETSVESQKMLQDYKVNSSLIKDFTRPTTLKKRYKADGKTLLRVSKLYQEPISTEIQSIFFDKVESTIDNMNLVIFSDFNYGCLPQELIDKIIDLCLTKKIFMAADSQSSSQLGDISRFKQMDFITATEHEARLALHNNSDGLIIISEALMKKSKTNNFILKLGKQGVLISSKSDSVSMVQTDGLEALNNFPVDVSGAGDSMLTASSMALCSGGNITESALIGSYAAAIQVSRNGNVPIDLNELTKATLA
jgi:rfaE bifunctional protein kinase chain/domain